MDQKLFETILKERKTIKESIKFGNFANKEYPIIFTSNTSLDELNPIFSIWQSGNIEIKFTNQKRIKGSIPIIRLDVNAYHTNPPFIDEMINFEIDISLKEKMVKYSEYKFKKESHLHYYIEDFLDKWAFPPEEFGVIVSDDMSETVKSLCDMLNIDITIKKEGLF